MVDSPSDKAVQAQLERLLSSSAFDSSPRMKRLLTHIIDKTLAGKCTDLNGYAIGLDVFDKLEGFDPQTDSIVRVQAGRLRNLLKSYYNDEGRNDSVIIELPKGSYVPHFHPRSVAPGPAIKEFTLVAVVILCAAIVAVFALFSDQRKENDFEHALTMPEGPVVTILPFRGTAESNDDDQVLASLTSNGFRFMIAEKLSRFRGLRVLHSDSVAQVSHGSSGADLKADYYLNGSVHVDGDTLNVTVLLIDATTGEIVWSDFDECDISYAATLFELESDVALGIVAALGAPSSFLTEDFARAAAALDAVEGQHYLCLLEFFEYVHLKSEDMHLSIRDCLEKSVEAYPDFSSAWAALSWLYGDEVRNQFNVRDEYGFDRALDAALKGVRADPRNATAQQYLAIAYFSLGNDAGFRRAADKALYLNPNDPDVLADVGSHLIQIDNSDQGAMLVEKAMLLNPNSPSWYHGSITMYYYTRGQSEKALFHAEQYALDGSLVSQVLYAAALMQANRLPESRRVYATLKTAYPDFESQQQALIQNWRLPDDMEEMLLADLVRMGGES